MTDIVGIIMLGFGAIFLFGWSILAYRKYRRIEKETRDIGTWVSTTGIITESDVYGTGGQESRAYVRLKYKFNVLGKEYESRHARFGGDLELTSLGDIIYPHVWKSRFRYGVGKPVTVYYSFNNPNRCTLVKSRGREWLVAAILTFFVGVYLISVLSDMV